MGDDLSKLYVDVESIPQTGFGMVGDLRDWDLGPTLVPVLCVQLHSLQGSQPDFGRKRVAATHSAMVRAHREYRTPILGSCPRFRYW